MYVNVSWNKVQNLLFYLGDKMCIKTIMCHTCVSFSLTSLILLAMTTTPVTASTVLMFCGEKQESSEGFRVGRGWQWYHQSSWTCTRQWQLWKTLTDTVVTQGASKAPLGTTGDGWQDNWCRGRESVLRVQIFVPLVPLLLIIRLKTKYRCRWGDHVAHPCPCTTSHS